MKREIVEPTTDKYGAEVHPAYGMIAAHRVTATPGAVLFDSEIRHHHYVTLTIQRASRKRDLNHDWLHGGQELIEVAMSEAQWASFVSSMNTSGVPCTITRTQDEVFVPGMSYAPRLALSMQETKQAADEAFEKVNEAFAAYKEKKTAANLRALETALDHVAPNVEFAAKTLVKHVENTVVKARADIEATVTRHAQTLGIEASDYVAPLALEAGDE